MEISHTQVDHIHVISPSGEFDLASAPKARAVFDTVIGKKVPAVVIDFSGVSYIDSSGLATIIDVFQRTKKYQGRVALCGMSRVVQNVFEIAKLDSVFKIYPDQAAAHTGLKS
ncbi:MAG: STAS domain-containing protein [Verrucomicrobiae bacterium]|nr:STAS domain-containing protein [Verrucomicrobiae bacterium]